MRPRAERRLQLRRARPDDEDEACEMRRDRAIQPIGARTEIDHGRGVARDTLEQRDDAFAVELTV